MSPSNKTVMVFLFVLAFAFSGTATAFCEEPAPEKGSGKNMFIRFYQEHISPADGGRCPMTPSCSEYAARAMEKHGLVLGWIMACDRLVRCGRDEVRLSPHVRINGEVYVSDPVSANDFWWFKNKEGEAGEK